jgi:hypothetical protein
MTHNTARVFIAIFLLVLPRSCAHYFSPDCSQRQWFWRGGGCDCMKKAGVDRDRRKMKYGCANHTVSADVVSALLRRDRVIVLGGLLAVAAGAWIYLLLGAASAVPQRSALFAAGYLLVWSGFSLAATLLQWGLDAAGLLLPTMAAGTVFWPAACSSRRALIKGRRLSRHSPDSGGFEARITLLTGLGIISGALLLFGVGPRRANAGPRCRPRRDARGQPRTPQAPRRGSRKNASGHGQRKGRRTIVARLTS